MIFKDPSKWKVGIRRRSGLADLNVSRALQKVKVIRCEIYGILVVVDSDERIILLLEVFDS